MINGNKTLYNQYSGIDLVKFICSILVVTIHVPPLGLNNPINGYISGYLARLAVPFFFIASSFFLYSKCLKNPTTEVSVIKQYLFRIIRLYLIWSIIYLPISLAQIYESNNGFSLSAILDFCRQSLFVGSFVHLWYLVSLVVSIILFSLLLRIFKERVYVVYIVCIILYGIGLLGQGYGFDYCTHTYIGQILTYIISLYDKIFETTRNGFFEAPVFIAIGYYFARISISFKLRSMIWGFISLMVLLFLEVKIVTDSFLKVYDYFIILVPASFCLFYISTIIKLNISKEISLLMRKMSTMIFFVHYWIVFLINNILKMVFDIDIVYSCAWFLSTIIITLLLSYVLIKLGNLKQTSKLQILYE